MTLNNVLIGLCVAILVAANILRAVRLERRLCSLERTNNTLFTASLTTLGLMDSLTTMVESEQNTVQKIIEIINIHSKALSTVGLDRGPKGLN